VMKSQERKGTSPTTTTGFTITGSYLLLRHEYADAHARGWLAREAKDDSSSTCETAK
jgi:hypothetical protein